VERPGGGRRGEGADGDDAEEAAERAVASLATKEEGTGPQERCRLIGGEARVDALGSGGDEAEERSGERNGWIGRVGGRWVGGGAQCGDRRVRPRRRRDTARGGGTRRVPSGGNGAQGGGARDAGTNVHGGRDGRRRDGGTAPFAAEILALRRDTEALAEVRGASRVGR
jgi:hypothetical protein